MFLNKLSRLALGLVALISVIPAFLAAADAPKKEPGLEEVGSMEVVQRMGFGWNLGNTMEACGDWIKGGQVVNYETAWGNPETTEAMIQKIKSYGFKSIRIPVAWSNLIGTDFTIDKRLLERVAQIVDYTEKNGMIAVVNIHWDGGWWSQFPKEPDATMKRFVKMWTQIAGYFKDRPGTLIFESLNEEGCFQEVWNRYGGGTGVQKKKAFDILNGINQTFVDLVRKSGGLNGKRHLLIAGYCTDIDQTVSPEFVMPKDPANHCIVSVHYYTPYTFAGLEKDETWGKARPTWGTPEDLTELDSNFKKVKARFLDQGIPVILGEYGSTLKTKEIESVRKYLWAVGGKSYVMGICPMLWDPGTHFDRRSLKFFDPKLLSGYQEMMERMKRDPMPQAPIGGAEVKK